MRDSYTNPSETKWVIWDFCPTKLDLYLIWVKLMSFNSFESWLLSLLALDSSQILFHNQKVALKVFLEAITRMFFDKDVGLKFFVKPSQEWFIIKMAVWNFSELLQAGECPSRWCRCVRSWWNFARNWRGWNKVWGINNFFDLEEHKAAMKFEDFTAFVLRQ